MKPAMVINTTAMNLVGCRKPLQTSKHRQHAALHSSRHASATAAHLVPHELGAGAEQVGQQAAHQLLEAGAVRGWHHIPAGRCMSGSGEQVNINASDGRLAKPSTHADGVTAAGPSTQLQVHGCHAGLGCHRAQHGHGAPLLVGPRVQVIDGVQVHVLCVPAMVMYDGAGVQDRAFMPSALISDCSAWLIRISSLRRPGGSHKPCKRCKLQTAPHLAAFASVTCHARGSPCKDGAPGADVEVGLVHTRHAEAVLVQRVAQQAAQAAQRPALCGGEHECWVNFVPHVLLA